MDDDFWKERDLPERFGPMTTKELRQGLRRGMFVFPFIGVHLFAVLAMVAEFQMTDAVRFTKYDGVLNLFLFLPGDMFSGPFWSVAGAVFLLLMPLGGLVLMGQELEEGNHELLLMTPLDRWKVVRGKFLSLWGICLLGFVSVIPYMIVRYFVGGMDVWRNIAMTLTVVLFSGMMAAGAIGASSFRTILGRILVLALFLGSMCASIAACLAGAGGVTEKAGVFWHLNAFAVAFCYIVLGLMLARSRIRLVVHQYEVQPSWMMVGLLFFTPFVVGMATAITIGWAGFLGSVGMGLVAWFADTSPKAPKWVKPPAPNIPSPPALPPATPGAQA